MTEQFEPTIIGFTCNWCSYRAADLAGTARVKYPPNIRLIRLMCSGRIDPTFVLKALAQGADAVMITGCHPGECHYLEQNYKALRRVKLLQRTLAQMGIEPGRVKLVWASAAEGVKLAKEITTIVEEVRALGPLNWPSATRQWQRGVRTCFGGGASMSENNGTSGTNGKPKFAMYWAASCGGCEIAVLNIGEKILDVDANFDVVFWPVAMDAKYKDVEAMPDKSITLTLFNGGIRNEENAHMAKLLRQKSQILVAFGSCASEGCIPGMANFSSTEQIFAAAYDSVSTENPDGLRPQFSYDMPEGTITIPTFNPVLKTLDQVVDVDYYMPGCPPESHQITAVVELVIKALHGEAELPPPGSVIGAGLSTVCDECKRQRNVKKITQFRRIHEVAEIDPDLCLLEQGILCNGPATRNGCGALCPGVNAACVGCYGPAAGVVDYGARLMTAVASVIDSRDPDEIDHILDGIVDPAGSFYRFNLAHSLLHAAKQAVS